MCVFPVNNLAVSFGDMHSSSSPISRHYFSGVSNLGGDSSGSWKTYGSLTSASAGFFFMGFPSKVNMFSIEATVLGDIELTLNVTMVFMDSQYGRK